MRVRRLIQRVRYAYLQYRAQALDTQPGDKRYLADLLQLLHPVDFARYKSELGHGRTLYLLYGSVGDMSLRMKEVADHMLEGEPVPAEWFRATAVSLSIDHWLSVHEGHYVKPEVVLVQFKENAQRLLELAIQHQKEKVGTQAYNLRVTRTLFLNLQEIVQALVLIGIDCLATP